MKKRYFFFLFQLFALSHISTCAQNPLVKMWDKTFGGLDDDVPSCFLQTPDGGFLIGGYTYSGIGGDKTQALKNAPGIADFWIVKTDSLGNKQWEKDLGGVNGEEIDAVIQTSDHGYVLGGMSASNISGDKSEPSWGNFDFWIIKIDSSGNILWDKDFGGTSSDQLTTLQQTNDGGFILGGTSSSNTSGNKSQDSRGAQDFWIVKTDSAGDLQWEKDFGGTDADKLYALKQTSDGGYILGGSSWSLAGGDKSGDSWGMDDYWVIRLDASGNRQWDKDFGGTDSDILYSLEQTSDGGFVLAGRSGSDVSGNKFQPLWGGYDFWLVKIDSLGNKQWDKTFGGTANEDEFGNISATDDGGFLLAGTSYSSISGNKTESNLGQEQSWILRLDSLFNIQWDKTVFTACHDEIGLALQTSGQCYTVVNSNGPACPAGGYRSDASWNGSRDFWIVKFCDSTYFPPLAAAAAGQNLCPGTCTSFLNLSTHALSYQWNFPGATPDTSTSENPSNICYHAPGNYDVTLIAINAHGRDTLIISNYVTVFQYPQAQGIRQSDDTLYANPGATTYQWYFDNQLIIGATEEFYVTLADGDYNVIATDSNGCEVEAAIFGVFTSVPAVNNSFAFEVFPNPSAGIMTLKFESLSEKSFHIKVRDITGRMLKDISLNAEAGISLHELDFSDFPKGIYFISAEQEGVQLKVLKAAIR